MGHCAVDGARVSGGRQKTQLCWDALAALPPPARPFPAWQMHTPHTVSIQGGQDLQCAAKNVTSNGCNIT